MHSLALDYSSMDIDVPSGFALIRSRKYGVVNQVPKISMDASIKDFTVNCKVGDVLIESEKSINCFATVVVSNDTRAEMFKALVNSIRECKNSIKFEAIYE